MSAQDILESEIHCYMFLETLRQAKNLGIVQILEAGSPLKVNRTNEISNEPFINDGSQENIF